eukprot:TRINITY_DN2235_c0_g1_i1.p1 TRINITY_DN2235_c0_g1~~TRINITY_DN2235_c0_g1_i1.p1  ORF type:complete len:113 (+),score=4.64 TRINITY_DN2235_c0_g1_i1:97-435(+)
MGKMSMHYWRLFLNPHVNGPPANANPPPPGRRYYFCKWLENASLVIFVAVYCTIYFVSMLLMLVLGSVCLGEEDLEYICQGYGGSIGLTVVGGLLTCCVFCCTSFIAFAYCS